MKSLNHATQKQTSVQQIAEAESEAEESVKSEHSSYLLQRQEISDLKKLLETPAIQSLLKSTEQSPILNVAQVPARPEL